MTEDKVLGKHLASGLVPGLQMSIGTFSILPVPRLGKESSKPAPTIAADTAGWAMVLSPLVALLLGAIASVVMFVLQSAWPASGISDLAAGAIAIALVAVLTGGLHWDGVADTADAIGSRRPPTQARKILKDPHVGAHGALAVVLLVLVQISALAVSSARGSSAVSLLVALMSSRLAAAWVCRESVQYGQERTSAPRGLGETVLGTARRLPLGAMTLLVMILSVVLATTRGDRTINVEIAAFLVPPLTVLCGVGIARWTKRRLGVVNGDVLGWTIELCMVCALLLLSLV